MQVWDRYFWPAYSIRPTREDEASPTCSRALRSSVRIRMSTISRLARSFCRATQVRAITSYQAVHPAQAQEARRILVAREA
jgi:hypothetical protein